MATCPHCDAWLDDRQTNPGEVLTCWNCQEEFVPRPILSAIPPPPPAPGDLTESPKHSQPEKEGTPTPQDEDHRFRWAPSDVLLIGIVLIAVLLAGLVIRDQLQEQRAKDAVREMMKQLEWPSFR